MSDIFQEVDEEVRRDKAVEFWTKHQNLIFAVAVVIVLATGGYRYYEYRRLQASEAAGAAFQQALELDRDGKAEEARAALAKVAADAPGGYQALARFAQAALTAKTDPKAGALAYDASPTMHRSIRCSGTPQGCARRSRVSTRARPTPPNPSSRRWRRRPACFATPRG